MSVCEKRIGELEMLIAQIYEDNALGKLSEKSYTMLCNQYEGEQEQQIVDYYSTIDKYIHGKLHSNAHQTVFTKENDKYQWLVLEQKSQSEVEVRQTDRHGTITARDNCEITRCVGAEHLCEGANIQIPFNVDEII